MELALVSEILVVLVQAGQTVDNDIESLASASEDTTVKIWERTFGQVTTFRDHSKAVRALAFSPDSKRLASASEDHTIWLYDAAIAPLPSRGRNGLKIMQFRWSHRGALEGHQGSVVSVSFSHDNKLLVSASSDNIVVVWDVDTMRKVGTVNRFLVPVVSANFSGADRTITVILNNGRNVQVWVEQPAIGRRGTRWMMDQAHSYFKPVLLAVMIQGEEGPRLFTVTSAGINVEYLGDGSRSWGLLSKLPVRTASWMLEDCVRLAGPGWVAAVGVEDTEDYNSQFALFAYNGEHPEFFPAPSNLRRFVVQSLRLQDGANEPKINPRTGETAYAIRGQNSIFVSLEVTPPQTRKSRPRDRRIERDTSPRHL